MSGIQDLHAALADTILVVDSDPNGLLKLATMLRFIGYDVLTAGNTREALERFEERKGGVTLLITDVELPETGWVGLLDALRDRKPDIKAIVTTDEPRDEKSSGLWPTRIISKPFDFHELAKTVIRTLEFE
jgi:DNA-binding NtrC family response regulator